MNTKAVKYPIQTQYIKLILHL